MRLLCKYTYMALLLLKDSLFGHCGLLYWAKMASTASLWLVCASLAQIIQ